MTSWRNVRFLAFALVYPALAVAQSTCSGPTATPVVIRNEGISEQVADLTFSCSGGSAAGTTNLLAFLSTPVTSKVLNAQTGSTEATAVTSAGASVQGTISGSQITFAGLFIPAGAFTVTITNVRVNASSVAQGGFPPVVTETMFISGSGVNAAALTSTPVAFVEPALAPRSFNHEFLRLFGAEHGFRPRVFGQLRGEFHQRF